MPKIKVLTRLACAAVTITFPLCADTVALILKSPGPAITGAPGDTIGWGFTLDWSSPTNWISVTSSALTFETNPTLGAYTDFIALQGGPEPFHALAPNTSWSEMFDEVTQQGIGSYAIDPGAVPFSQNSGFIRVFYDIFDGNPSLGGAQIGSSEASRPFDVRITEPIAAVPEPSTLRLSLVLVLLLLLRVGGCLIPRCYKR